MRKIAIGAGALALSVLLGLAVAAQEKQAAVARDDRAAALGYDGGLACVLRVKSMPDSLAWYRDVLGFALQYRRDDLSWCELSSPVARVSVGLSQQPPPEGQSSGGATLTFGVVDIERARAELERRKVAFDGPTQTIAGLVKLAGFHDPDGNRLMLYQGLRKE